MRLQILFILIVCSFSTMYCQVSKIRDAPQRTNCKKLCEINKKLLFSKSKINYNVSDLMVNGKEVGRHLENGVDIWKVINCCKLVDMEFTKEIILKFCKNKYESIVTKSNRGGEIFNSYSTVNRLLENLSGKEAFEIGMLYFSFDKEGKDFDMDYVGPFSLSTFEYILIPMLEIKQQKYYQQLYGDMYLDFLISNTQDDSYKTFHKQFFPVFKADWESGQIKLKTQEPSQEKK